MEQQNLGEEKSWVFFFVKFGTEFCVSLEVGDGFLFFRVHCLSCKALLKLFWNWISVWKFSKSNLLTFKGGKAVLDQRGKSWSNMNFDPGWLWVDPSEKILSKLRTAMASWWVLPPTEPSPYAMRPRISPKKNSSQKTPRALGIWGFVGGSFFCAEVK